MLTGTEKVFHFNSESTHTRPPFVRNVGGQAFQDAVGNRGEYGDRKRIIRLGQGPLDRDSRATEVHQIVLRFRSQNRLRFIYGTSEKVAVSRGYTARASKPVTHPISFSPHP